VFVAAVAGTSFLFLASWTKVNDASLVEADRVFSAAIAEAGGGPPFIEIADDGTVVIHREQESEKMRGFDTLTLLYWTPANGEIRRVDYPHWFVRLKTSSAVNLGTMIAAARKDWGHLDLSVSYDDLMRRGPALLLDHELENRSRIMIWTSSGGD
jgi:hypothetical protein